jgi:hypothetical protein
MLSRTEKITEEMLFRFAPLKNIPQFLENIEKHIQDLKNQPEQNTIVHYGFSSKEIPNFIGDAFSEIKDQKKFLSLLKIFGFNTETSGAYVFFDGQNPGGFLITQHTGPNISKKSDFLLMCQRGKDGSPVFNITGVYGGRILVAGYLFKPYEGGYFQTSLDIGVTKEEMAGFRHQIISADEYGLNSNPLITKKMKDKAPKHEWFFRFYDHPVTKMPPFINTRLINIPQKIATC